MIMLMMLKPSTACNALLNAAIKKKARLKFNYSSNLSTTRPVRILGKIMVGTLPILSLTNGKIKKTILKTWI